MDDGRHVRLELRFAPGAPTTRSVFAGLSLVLWRGHPYYLASVTYDEHRGPLGERLPRLYEIAALRLVNTFAGQPDIILQKGRDKLEEIEGTISVSVTQL